MKRTISLILTLALAFSAMLGIVSGAEDAATTGELSISGANIEFGDTVYLYFAVDYSAVGLSDDITLKVTNNATGETKVLVRNESVEKTKGFPANSIGFKLDNLGAKNMGDELTIQAFKGENQNGKAKTFSVLEYSLKVEDIGEQKLVNLVRAMINYGAKAQASFGHLSDSKVKADYVYALQDSNKKAIDYSLVTLPNGATFSDGSTKAIMKAGDTLEAEKSDANDDDWWLNAAIQKIGQGKKINVAYKADNQDLFIAPASVFGTNQYYFDMDEYTGNDINLTNGSSNSAKKPTINGYSTGMILNAGNTVDITTGYIKATGNCSIQYVATTELQKAIKEAYANEEGERKFTLSFTLSGDAASTAGIFGYYALRSSRTANNAPVMYSLSKNTYTKCGGGDNKDNFGALKNVYYEVDETSATGYKKVDLSYYGRSYVFNADGFNLTSSYNADASATSKKAVETVLTGAAGEPGLFSTIHVVFDLDAHQMSYYAEGSKTAAFTSTIPVTPTALTNSALEHVGSANMTLYLKSIILTQGNVTQYFD